MRAKFENQRNMKLLATFLTTIHGVSLPPSLGWFNSYCDMIPCDRSGVQVCGSDGVTFANECERIRELSPRNSRFASSWPVPIETKWCKL